MKQDTRQAAEHVVRAVCGHVASGDFAAITALEPIALRNVDAIQVLVAQRD